MRIIDALAKARVLEVFNASSLLSFEFTSTAVADELDPDIPETIENSDTLFNATIIVGRNGGAMGEVSFATQASGGTVEQSKMLLTDDAFIMNVQQQESID